MAAKLQLATRAVAPAVRAPRTRSVARPGDGDFYRGDHYPICESMGYLLRQVRASFDRVIDAEMAEHDLTGVQWGPLLMIHHGMGTTAAEIARIAGVDTGAMTRLLDRLEAKKLIRRTPCAKDRRVVQLELTSAGTRLCSEIPFGLARANNRLLAGFTRDEFRAVEALLRRMLSNLDDR